MGTSTRWPGPKGGAWVGTNRTLLELERQATDSTPNKVDILIGDSTADDTNEPILDAAIARIGDDRYKALRETLRDNPDAYGLQRTMLVTGARLVDTLDQLASSGPTALGSLSGDTPDTRMAAFVQQFVDCVVGAASSPANAAARRTAVRCAVEILEDPHIRRSVERGDNLSEARLSSELLCWIYRLFFANAIAQFIQATITAKINVLLPWWHIVDPAGRVATWLTDKIIGLLPNPCEDKQDQGDSGNSIADVARSLITDTVQRTLGIQTETAGAT